jgi:hypothetical protein
MDLLHHSVVERDWAVDFVASYVKHIGAGYHPDTAFAEYVDGAGRPVFGEEDGAKLDALTDAAFSFLGSGLYEVAAKCQRQLFTGHEL